MHLIPSHRGRPSDDPIFSLNAEAKRRSQAGESIVNATIGVLLDDDGNLTVLPTAARAIRDVPSLEWAAYAPIAGTPDFLRAVLDDVLGGEPELRRIATAVATPGGSGAVRHAIANFLEPGQAMLTTDWFWMPYRTLCEEAERRLETFEMWDQDGGLDVASLDAALGRLLAAQGRALVVLNDPCHNPTGYSMTDAEWRAVVDCLLARADAGPITLLVDSAYVLYGAKGSASIASHLRPLVERCSVLFAWSASKSFTCYGLRVGALVACIADDRERTTVENALIHSCRGTWSNCNRGGLAAVTRLLVDGALSRTCSAERAEAKALLAARVREFNRHARTHGLRYPRYDGGFFVTVFGDGPHEKAESMRARGVYVVPQVAADGEGALRVALCAVAERDIERLVKALAS